jgi:hypothetical protein
LDGDTQKRLYDALKKELPQSNLDQRGSQPKSKGFPSGELEYFGNGKDTIGLEHIFDN